MYLQSTATYYRNDGEQHVARGRFLILLQPKRSTINETVAPKNTYAIVRKVALRQLGHFMMGRVRIGTEWHSVSGAYGSDGLPMSIDRLPKDAKPLPQDLYDAWNHGGGWNSSGSEASAMRKWANATFK